MPPCLWLTLPHKKAPGGEPGAFLWSTRLCGLHTAVLVGWVVSESTQVGCPLGFFHRIFHISLYSVTEPLGDFPAPF